MISVGARRWNFNAPQPIGCDRSARDEEHAGRRAQLVGIRGDAQRRIEARVEARAELGEVRIDATSRIGFVGIGRGDLDQARGQQALDVAHRGDEARLLMRVERFEERGRELVAACVEHRSLAAAGAREPRGAHALVGGVRPDGDKSRAFERASTRLR